MSSHLKSLWLVETIRLIEQQSGRFSDQEANRQAMRWPGPLKQKIIYRAEWLAQQNGVVTAQHRLINAVKLAFILLFFISILLGAGLAFTALSYNPVNLYWALLSLLGLHFLTLLIWLVSILIAPSDSGSVFIYCWMWLIKRFTDKQTTQQLLPAFISLAGKPLKWLIGTLVNLWWTVVLVSALLMLLLLLATHHYQFEWQSTLFSSDTFIYLTHGLGALPAFLGFAMPDNEMIRLSGEQALNQGDIRSVWAMWLLGVFIVYGLFIRLSLLIICSVRWFWACSQFDLNEKLPEYQLLATLLQPKQTEIIDAAQKGGTPPVAFTSSPVGQGALLVAVDIDEQQWTIPDGVTFAGFLNNSQQRGQLLDHLTLEPAHKLMIAINSDRAPDRGMINLIRQLQQKSEVVGIWFINQGHQYANWQSCLAENGWQDVSLDWLKEQ